MSESKDLKPEDESGWVVQDADGRFYFLSEQDARMFRIENEDSTKLLRQLWAKAASHQAARQLARPLDEHPGINTCRQLKRWLDTHNPRLTTWRRLSLIWADNCL
jgi:hypothetical protein